MIGEELQLVTAGAAGQRVMPRPRGLLDHRGAAYPLGALPHPTVRVELGSDPSSIDVGGPLKPLEVELLIDIEGLSDELGLSHRRVEFAAAKTLTRLAVDSQEQVRRELPRRFEIRNKGVAQGIRIKPATRKDLSAAVGSIDEFMVLQETGGTKRSRSGQSLAVPDSRREPGAIKRSRRGAVTKATSPAGLLGQKHGPIQRRRASPGKGSTRRRHWVAAFADGRVALVRTRTNNRKVAGKRRLRTKSGRLGRPRKVLSRKFSFVWTFKRTAKIRPRFGLLDITTKVVDRRLQARFTEALNEELLDLAARGDR